MKILVTGGAGFIGFHLVNLLVNELNRDIIIIDNLSEYYDYNLKRDRLIELGFKLEAKIDNSAKIFRSKKYSNLSFIKISIEDKFELDKLFNVNKFDLVVHLAAQAGVRYSIDHPEEYINCNINGFFNVVDISRIYGIKNILYASSSSIYGTNEETPFSESHRVDSQKSLYAVTKRTNELIANVYSDLYNMRLIGLRFFTVFGPWGRPDMAPFIFSDAIVNNKEIQVYNNGEMSRDFTNVEDVVQLINKIINRIECSEFIKESYVVNIGNGSPISLMKFISLLEDSFKIKPRLVFMGMQLGDVKDTFADNSLIKKMFSDFKFTDLELGILNFVKWYKNYYRVK